MVAMIRKMLSIFDRKQRVKIYVLLLLILGGALMETLGVSAILPLVSAVTDPSIIETNKYFKAVSDIVGVHDHKTFILILTLGLIAVYVVKNIYLILLNIAQNTFTNNTQRRMSVSLMKSYIQQNFLFHSYHNVADLERNVNRDINSLIYVLTNLLMLFTEVMVCAMLALFLLITDFSTTIVLVLIMLGFMFFFIKIVRKKLKFYGNNSRLAEAEKSKFFLEAFGGIKEVKATSTEDYFVEKFDKSFAKFTYAKRMEQILTYIPRPLMESICICGILLFMAIRIMMGTDVNSFIPVMSVFAVAAIRMLPSFNRISGYIGSIMFHKTSIDGLYDDLMEMRRLEDNNESDNGQEIPSGDIVIRELKFAYPSKQEKMILDGVSFTVPYNKSVAFVGPSGAGKTTLADLILGVLNPNSGEVSVGGVDVIQNKSTWHRNVGYIPQTTYLTDDTIRANVAFGIEEDKIDDAKVYAAIEAAQLSDFIKEQKDGIYSNIGDRGVKISGGQRQRIGIARALYNNPGVIVLDEATSALDNETEKAVMDAIYQLSGKKTIIIIAHRLTTIKNCDLIYEIRDGKATQVTYEEYNADH
ncbi:ABC transporter ATP-binding protein [Butyrivibrio sp. AE2032]|uniref:ABC transporter ATP-binding protein n=1 Tax=Butyrivibrio sp. AE2032 TaxID=1458463 RepID=UPI00054D7C51|nr:ABC transporter ATP-binding protein [Butyrivibrio sp. AE2032]